MLGSLYWPKTLHPPVSAKKAGYDSILLQFQCGVAETGGSLFCWPDSLAELVSSRLSERHCLKGKMRKSGALASIPGTT